MKSGHPGLEAVRCCLTDLSPIGRLSGSATVNCCSTEGWRWIAVLAQLALWTCWNETLTPWPGPPARTLPVFARERGARSARLGSQDLSRLRFTPIGETDLSPHYFYDMRNLPQVKVVFNTPYEITGIYMPHLFDDSKIITEPIHFSDSKQLIISRSTALSKGEILEIADALHDLLRERRDAVEALAPALT